MLTVKQLIYTGVCSKSPATYHVYAVQDLVADIAADAHVSSPCGCIEGHIGGVILCLKVGVKLLPQQQEDIGDGCACQTSTCTHKGKQEPLHHTGLYECACKAAGHWVAELYAWYTQKDCLCNTV